MEDETSVASDEASNLSTDQAASHHRLIWSLYLSENMFSVREDDVVLWKHWLKSWLGHLRSASLKHMLSAADWGNFLRLRRSGFRSLFYQIKHNSIPRCNCYITHSFLSCVKSSGVILNFILSLIPNLPQPLNNLLQLALKRYIQIVFNLDELAPIRLITLLNEKILQYTFVLLRQFYALGYQASF